MNSLTSKGGGLRATYPVPIENGLQWYCCPMRPSQAFNAHREELREIVTRHGVLRPRIFGSAVRGEDTEGSDLDLLVDPAANTTLMTLAAIQIEAERLPGVHVDVITPKRLPQHFRERVLREAIPV